MFAYCENNPINRVDPKGENADIAQWWTATMWWLCASDTALPVGDIIYVGGVVILWGIALYGSCVTVDTYIDTVPIEEEEKDIAPAIPDTPPKQAYFPVNPYDFQPNGLVRMEFSGSGNGKIIKWRDPISDATIFEWDEDYKYGSHYHVMLIEWDEQHDGTHYKPGEPVPEPWNSTYF